MHICVNYELRFPTLPFTLTQTKLVDQYGWQSYDFVHFTQCYLQHSTTTSALGN